MSNQASRTAPVTAMRRACLAMLVLLLIQYGLGMAVNLYVKVPAGHPELGQAFAKAITQGAPALAIHASLGLLLVLNAIGLVVQGVKSGRRNALAAAIVGLLALAGAAFNGASFVSNGRPYASLAMALLTALALLSYVVALYSLD
ncbi:MAG: hypothetical protein DLM54_07965 [Acidimicrobiales bacterium]|nr:MAG: hypothetical protein DLM54_07965 [Acidimicrobiales bacterium]